MKGVNPEEQEFAAAAEALLCEKERLGGHDRWAETHFTRNFTLFRASRSNSADTGEGKGAGCSMEDRTAPVVFRMREMSTALPSAAGHDLGRCGAGGTGDMAFSGVHTWPSAEALSQLAFASERSLSGCLIVELGAGTGLPSMAAAAWAETVVVTDSAEEILENFRQNMIRNATALPGGFRARFLVEPLRWEAESAQSDLQGRVAVVLGAEILHEMEAMPWLAATVGSLLATPTARKRRESDAEREEDDDIGTVLRRCGLAVGCAFGGIFLGISPRSRRDAIDAFKSECKRWQDSETCLQVWEWFACDGCEGPLSPWRHTTRWSRDPETEPGDENEELCLVVVAKVPAIRQE